jgi:hypothetical protein
VDTFTFVEHGVMDLMFLTGRTAKQFARVEDPVLLNREAAAELAQAIIHIRARFSPESPIHVNGDGAAAVAAPEPAGLPVVRGYASSTDVWQYLKAHGPLTKAELREALGLDSKSMGNRLAQLQGQGRIRNVGGRWQTARAPSGTMMSADLEDWLAQVGSATYDEIRQHFNVSHATLASRVGYLRGQGRIVDDGDRVRLAPGYEPEPEPAPRPTLKSQYLLVYIQQHPGLTKGALAEALGVDGPSLKLAIDNLRRRDHVHVDPETGGYHSGKGRPLTKEETQRLSVKARQAPEAVAPAEPGEAEAPSAFWDQAPEPVEV